MHCDLVLRLGVVGDLPGKTGKATGVGFPLVVGLERVVVSTQNGQRLEISVPWNKKIETGKRVVM